MTVSNVLAVMLVLVIHPVSAAVVLVCSVMIAGHGIRHFASESFEDS